MTINMIDVTAKDLVEIMRESDISLIFGPFDDSQAYSVHSVTTDEIGHFGNEPMIEVTFDNGMQNWFEPTRHFGVIIHD